MATKGKSRKGKVSPGGSKLIEDLGGPRILRAGDAMVMRGQVEVPSPVIGAPPRVLPAGSMGLVVECGGTGECSIVFPYGGGLLTAAGITDEMLQSAGAVMVWDSLRGMLVTGGPTPAEEEGA